MPITGQDKAATPLAVYEAMVELFGNFMKSAYPKPKKNESFNDYLARIDWKEEAIFYAMIAVGNTTDGSKPNQRNYLGFLSDMQSCLFKVQSILYKKWPK